MVMMHGSLATFEQQRSEAAAMNRLRVLEQMKAESMFVSYVFHEMRNPFNGMVGHIECIEETVGGAIKLVGDHPHASQLQAKLNSIISDLDR